MTCPSNPPAPTGYRVWRGAVPTPLTQWAMDLRDHIRAPAYGTTWSTTYGGKTALARKDYHTWTYKNGELVTGICIPGITLYEQLPTSSGGHPIPSDTPDVLQPDPTLAMYGADDVPGVNWGLVIGSAAAGAAVVGLFIWAVKAAGNKPDDRRRLRKAA